MDTFTFLYLHVCAVLVCKYTHIHTHTRALLLACAHHFTIMWTDLWPWGQMVVLNSITVRVQPVLSLHCSSAVAQCWCSSKIKCPHTPTAAAARGYVLHVILDTTPCYSDYVTVPTAEEEWLEWDGLASVSTGEAEKQAEKRRCCQSQSNTASKKMWGAAMLWVCCLWEY